jgi:hypothetical protein
MRVWRTCEGEAPLSESFVNYGQLPGDVTGAWLEACAALPGEDWWLFGVKSRRPRPRSPGGEYEAWAGNGEFTVRATSTLSPADALVRLKVKLKDRFWA